MVIINFYIFRKVVTCGSFGKIGKMGKNFLKTKETSDNLKHGADGINGASLKSQSTPYEFAIFSPPVGEAPSQAFAYFFSRTVTQLSMGVAGDGHRRSPPREPAAASPRSRDMIEFPPAECRQCCVKDASCGE
jgi:hypothetical protein